MNAKSLPPELRFKKYAKYFISDQVQYLCGVTRKNYCFLYYKTGPCSRWKKYPYLTSEDLHFNPGALPKDRDERIIPLTVEEFFAEIL